MIEREGKWKREIKEDMVEGRRVRQIRCGVGHPRVYRELVAERSQTRTGAGKAGPPTAVTLCYGPSKGGLRMNPEPPTTAAVTPSPTRSAPSRWGRRLWNPVNRNGV